MADWQDTKRFFGAKGVRDVQEYHPQNVADVLVEILTYLSEEGIDSYADDALEHAAKALDHVRQLSDALEDDDQDEPADDDDD